MIKAVIFSLLAGIGGLFIAIKFVPGVTFQGPWTTLLIVGTILGIVIAATRPLFNLISSILRILVLGVSSIAILWILKIVFPALVITGFVPLVTAAAIVAALALILSLII